jgi:hypothetical protein
MKKAPGSSETSFLQEPHGVTSQKTPFFIVTAVKTSNLTWIDLIQNKRQVEGSCERGNEPSCSITCLESSWVAAQLAASQEEPSSMESVNIHDFNVLIKLKQFKPYRDIW